MFPTIPTGGRVVTGTQTGTSGTRTFPSLTGLTKTAGDLLIAIVVAYQNSSGAGAPGGSVFSSWGGGFTEFCDQMTTNASTMAIGAAYKKSTGSETGTFTVTQAATPTGDAAFILLSIPNWDGVTVPEVTTIVNGTTSAANPASLNPANWGTEDTLWIAVAASGETSTGGTFGGISTAPSNYTDTATTSISQDAVGGVQAGVAFRQLNAASEDVGTWTLDTSNARNSAVVIAVRPVPVGVSDSPITFTVGSAGVASRQGIVSWAAFETPLAIGAGSASGASAVPITFTVGSAGTPKAYGASTSAFTVGVSSAGTPTAYGASAVPITFTVGSAGTSLPRASSTVPIAFTVGSAGTPKAYGVSSSAFTFGVDSAGSVPSFFLLLESGDQLLLEDGGGVLLEEAVTSPTGASDSQYTFTVGSAGTSKAYGAAATPLTFGVSSTGAPKAYGASTSTYTFGVDSAGTAARQGIVSWAAFETPLAITSAESGSSSLPITFTVGSAGTSKAYGSSTSTYTVGIDSSGSVPHEPRIAAAGLVYLFGDLDDIVFGSASVGLTLSVSSNGTPKAYGASSSSFTLAESSSGTPTAYGASATPISFGVSSSGTTKAYGASAVPISFVADSSGTATTVGTGSASATFTVGIDSAGTPKAYGASSSAFTVGISSAGVPSYSGASASTYTFDVSSSGTPRGAASATSTFTLTVSSNGTPRAYGASSSAYTVGISSTGVPGYHGVSASTYTLSIDSAGTGSAVAGSTLPLTLQISTSGTPKAYGSSSSTYTFGVDSEGNVLYITGMFGRPRPGGASRARPGANMYDRPTPGRAVT